MRSKKVSKKVTPTGPQMDHKSRPKSIECISWSGSKDGRQKGSLSRTRKSEIWILFSTL